MIFHFVVVIHSTQWFFVVVIHSTQWNRADPQPNVLRHPKLVSHGVSETPIACSIPPLFTPETKNKM
jgi:hypothetical protein